MYVQVVVCIFFFLVTFVSARSCQAPSNQPRMPKKGAKKKGKGKGTGSKKKGKKASTKASTASVEVAQYGFVKVRLVSATFVSQPRLPCHVTRVYRGDTTVLQLKSALKESYSDTLMNLIVFEGELRGAELVQTSEGYLDDMSSLAYLDDIELYPSIAEAEDNEAYDLFYDFEPITAVTASALITQDGYFLEGIGL
eukprot:m.84019 g.84019  ORF g.84019 m.84019 type:complete len:196 (+) comp12735_c0_seq1:142-729(+)